MEECGEAGEAGCAARCGKGADKDGEAVLQVHSFVLQVGKKVPKKLYNPIKTVPPLIEEKASNFFKQVSIYSRLY